MRLDVNGDFDSSDVDAFEGHVEDALQEPPSRLLLDGTRIRLINSTAIQSLLRAQVRLQENGGDLAVSGLSPFVKSVFGTLGIDRRVRCFDSDHEALEWLRSGG